MRNKFWNFFSKKKMQDFYPVAKKPCIQTQSSKKTNDHEVDMSMEDPFIYGRCGYDHVKKQG